MFQIDPAGAKNADNVETGVGKETLILGGENGVAQNRRNLVIVDETLFFAITVMQIGDELRLQIVAGPFRVVAQGNDTVNFVVREDRDRVCLAEAGIRLPGKISIESGLIA